MIKTDLASLGGSVGCAVRLETRRSRGQPPLRSATFFRGDWSWNISKMVAVHWPRWLPCPYVVKTFKNLLLQNRGRLGAESLHNSLETGGLPKLLQELSEDNAARRKELMDKKTIFKYQKLNSELKLIDRVWPDFDVWRMSNWGMGYMPLKRWNMKAIDYILQHSCTLFKT